MKRFLRALAVIAACFAFAPMAQAAHRHHHHYHHYHHHLTRHHVRQVTPHQVTLEDFFGGLNRATVTYEPSVFGRTPSAWVSEGERSVAIPRGRVYRMIAGFARRLGVSERLAVAVAIQEGASCTKVGGVGERGPMQVRPQTAHAMGMRPHTCAEWAYAGVAYLKQVLNHQMRYGLLDAVSAYNHGWGRVYASAYGRKVLHIMSRI